MNKLLIYIALILLPFTAIGQINRSNSNNKLYKYYVYYYNSSDAPQFKKTRNGLSYYIGKNKDLIRFFSQYQIVSFYQSLPKYPVEKIKRVYTLETYDNELMNDFLNTFPSLVEKYEDITEMKFELFYYPNDYGITSPNGGQGINIDRRELDYIDAPKAWDINTGQGVTIGISDARIIPDDPDFIEKITFLPYPQYPYGSMAYNPNNGISHHGTSVAAIAAAQGDNNYGSTGICFDCKIVAARYGNYNYLLYLAKAGARVINMSWGSNTYNQVHQDAVNHLTEMGVVLVAASGNRTSHQTQNDFLCGITNSVFNTNLNQFVPQYTGMQYHYPASYDNVISVCSVEYYNTSVAASYCCTSSLGDIGTRIQDSFSESLLIDDINNPIGLKYNSFPQYCFHNGTPHMISPLGIVNTYSYNEFVDILAPSNGVYNHVKLAEEQVVGYHQWGGTSHATPFVSGTAALMIGTYNCITPKEVENILKLTAKDVVNLPMNAIYKDYIGTGKLETGNAVEFVNEMKKSNGNAKIKDHIFNRFSFDLKRINNLLTIENVTFKDNCIADFTAKNKIHLKQGTHLKPNTTGYTHLKIDPTIVMTCQNMQKFNNDNTTETTFEEIIDTTPILVYPNPNDGLFEINFDNLYFKNLSITILDTNGRIIYNKTVNSDDLINNTLKVAIQNYNSGIYFLKIESDTINESFKIIKKITTY